MTKKSKANESSVGIEMNITNSTVDQDERNKRKAEDEQGRNDREGRDRLNERAKRDDYAATRDCSTARTPISKRQCTESLSRDLGMVERSLEVVLEVPSPKDELNMQAHKSIVSWIFEQPYNKTEDVKFFQGDKHPYSTACDWIKKAIEMGNQSSRQRAAKFMQLWRKSGLLFDIKCQDDTLENAWQIYNVTQESSQRFNANLRDRGIVSIKMRVVAALLYEVYQHKVDQLKLCAQGKNIIEIRSGIVTQLELSLRVKVKEKFHTGIEHGQLWYTMAQALGWGSLLFVPYPFVTNQWVHRTLRLSRLPIWLELIKMVNPDVKTAGKLFDTWLGSKGIAQDIRDKPLLKIESNFATNSCGDKQKALQSELYTASALSESSLCDLFDTKPDRSLQSTEALGKVASSAKFFSCQRLHGAVKPLA
jgi:hypothetical protein